MGKLRWAALSGVVVLGLLVAAPVAGAKPPPKPTKSVWTTYTLTDDNGDPFTISLRLDPTRPVFNIEWPNRERTTVRIRRMCEANSDTLEPYEGSEINFLDQRWTLLGPTVGTSYRGCTGATAEVPNTLNFSYAGDPRRNRYDGLSFDFHSDPTGLLLKFDFCLVNYQWVSTDPTAALVVEWDVFPTGTKRGEPTPLVYSHFDGTLIHDPFITPDGIIF